jgi:predicted dinucleotide-binding enzyme
MGRRMLLAAILLIAGVAHAETVAVIGTGNVGMALGTEFASIGHTVIYGSRSPLSLKTLDLVTKTGKGASAALPADAAAKSDIVVLAVPGMVTGTVAEGLGDLGGKIIIDATNPLKRESEALQFEYGVETSNGEIVQAIHPDAHVVKAFNTISWRQMIDPEADNTPPVVPLASNSEEAKEKVAEFVRAMDLEPVDLGELEYARWSELTVVVMLNNQFSDREKFDVFIQPRD